MANFECSGCGSLASTSQPFTSRKEFQILVTNPAPCCGKLSSNSKSPPAGEQSNMPTRNAIGPIRGNQIKRIRRISQRFRHFATLFVAHHSSKIHVFERKLLPIFVSGDDHTSHPEENNIRSSYQIIGWIIIIDFVVIGFAKHHRKRKMGHNQLENQVSSTSSS